MKEVVYEFHFLVNSGKGNNQQAYFLHTSYNVYYTVTLQQKATISLLPLLLYKVLPSQ